MKTPKFRCPCCGFATLNEQSSFDICVICWWEDDGQDDPHAGEVWCGPNGELSLSVARANFRDHGHMYPAGQGIDVVRFPSPERKELIRYVMQVVREEEPLNLSLFGSLLLAEEIAREME